VLPPLFTLLIFLIGSSIYAQAGLDLDPLIYASCAAGMTGTCFHAQLLLVEMGVLPKVLPWLASNCDPPHLYFPSS
jgi:hypothetical protein